MLQIFKMKRITFILFISISILTFFVSGCKKDNITTIDNGNEDTENQDDYIDSTTFTQNVYITFSSGNVSVTGTNSDFSVTTDGSGVTITYSGSENVKYYLSGTASDGFFKLYSSQRQAIVLENAYISNSSGAAVNIQSSKRTFIVINGDNTLADGSSYSTTSGEDEKAALFSEGQLIFSGDGTLTVNAKGKSGIVSDEYIIFNGGTINITVSSSAFYDSDNNEYKGTAGIKADSWLKIKDGSITITNSGTGGKGISCDGSGYLTGGTVRVTTTGYNHTAGDISAKAIKFDGNLTFSGSKVVASCNAHEGIEAKGTITISGGEVYSYSAQDDAINSGGTFTISGGYVYGYAPNNDALDANGNFYITGGTTYAIGASSPEVAIDANTEDGYKLYVQGGTLIAIGGLESNSSLSQNCYYTSSWTKNTWYAITVGSTTYAFKTPSSGGSNIVVSGSSTPTLKKGVSVNGGTSYFEELFYSGASVSGGESVTLSSYSGGGNGPGGGGGPGH